MKQPLFKTIVAGAAAAAIAGILMVASASAQTKDIVDTAVAAGSFKTLARALDAAGLVQTLKGKGPFTVFAPADEAFAKLPAGTVEMLLKPENKGTLTSVLTYHVVPGRLNSKALERLIKQGGGTAKLKTVQGEELSAKLSGDMIEVVDSKGGMAKITIANVNQSNGVIHVIDKVLMP